MCHKLIIIILFILFWNLIQTYANPIKKLQTIQNNSLNINSNSFFHFIESQQRIKRYGNLKNNS